MVKLYITTLAVCLTAAGSAMAQDATAPAATAPTPTPGAAAPIAPIAPIAPPTQITPLAPATAPATTTTTTTTTTVSPEQPAPIEPPVTDPNATMPAPGAQTGVATDPNAPGATAPVTGVPGAPTATGTGAPAVAGGVPHSVNDFQGDDITQVFRVLARQAKISLIVSDKITGTVTVRLENKTPLEAIEIIADSKNLVFEKRKNDIYYVVTQEEKTHEPLVNSNYTFSYAMANKVKDILDKQLAGGISQVDERTNTVFYSTPKSNLDNVKLFLGTIDQPTRQVMIEARLVEVTANPQQAYGINWAGVVGSNSTPQVITYGATTGGASTQTPTGPFALGDSNTTNFLKSLTHLGQLATGQLAILSAPQMSIAMQFLNEDSDAEFLANPRVVTANNQKAEIKITRNQPVPQLNFNEQTATAVFGGFQDKVFGNTLDVTPSINKDNFITLNVKPEISNKVADATFTFAGATVASPIIDTRTLDSTVLIKSGDTLAVGGLLQDEVTKTRSKVPVVGDIPVIGYAFQSRQNNRTKRNLLVFVTPTIINQGYGTGLEDQVSGLNHSGDEYADPNGWRNNAKGAVRLKPTSNNQLASEYPKPGEPAAPKKVNYKVNAAAPEE